MQRTKCTTFSRRCAAVAAMTRQDRAARSLDQVVHPPREQPPFSSSARWLNPVAIGALVLTIGCFQEDKKRLATPSAPAATEVSGELFERAARRGLSKADTEAAISTFVPTGGGDEHIGILTTGTSGRLAVFGIPSMRILKYVALFTPEPWQGFAYDDESRAMLENSSREDVKYDFGDSGEPALSRTEGRSDGVALFVADAAHARIGLCSPTSLLRMRIDTLWYSTSGRTGGWFPLAPFRASILFW